MTYSLPSLSDLLDRTRKAYRTFLPGTDAYVWPNNIGPTAKVVAGGVFEVFGYAAYIAKMIFVSTAPDIETLRLHANEYGMAQLPATPASGLLAITAGLTNVTVAANAIWQRSDGVQYVVEGGATITAGNTATVTVDAILDGATANAPAGTALSAVSGVTGDATAVFSADAVGGADVEDIESFRARILFRKRNPPHGGNAADYVFWGRSVVGVTRVFVERRWNGPGTIRVFPLMDDLFPNGIPDAGAVARVQTYIETVCPAGATVTYAAPTAVTVNITITGLSPNTVVVQEAVRASLRDAFRRLSRVAGNDVNVGNMDYLAYPTTFSLSWIWQAVAEASGETRHQLTSPSADVALTAGQIATLGTVTFA